MAIDLLDLLTRAVTPDLAAGLGRAGGAAPSAVNSVVSTLLPALLGGMAHRAATPAGAGQVFATLTAPGVDADIGQRIGGQLDGGQVSSLTQLGGQLLGSLFGGDRGDALGRALGASTGVGGGVAKDLAMMVLPMVFGMLKKHVVDARLDAGATATLLREQVPHLRGRLDDGLLGALGLDPGASLLAGLSGTAGGATAAGAATAHTVAGAARPAAATAAATTAAAGSGLARWLPWVIGGAVALLLLSQLSRCASPATPVDTAAVATTTPPPLPTPSAPTATGAPLSVTTTDAAATLPQKVYFATGSADIDAAGNDAVAAAARWAAANAARKVGITGYTDRTGDADANEALAKNRALAVRSALERAGVAADRIDARKPVFVEVGAGTADQEARRVEISAE